MARNRTQEEIELRNKAAEIAEEEALDNKGKKKMTPAEKRAYKKQLKAQKKAAAERASAQELEDDREQAEIDELKTSSKRRKQDRRVFGQKDSIYDKLRPREGYVFKSDYFIIDGDQYCCIMNFFHNEGASDRFPPFWGINMLPRGLSDDIIIHRFDQFKPMPQAWVDSQQTKAEGVADISLNEQARGGTSKEKSKAARRNEDFQTIAQEVLSGAAYLDVSFRLMVKAPSLEKLDEAIEHIERGYKDALGTVFVSPYYGDQRRELETLFYSTKAKVGKHFMFTSDELAGNYSLVTHGFEDAHGEYIGKMYGDVNSAAILFDCDNYTDHVVIAGTNKARTLSKHDFKGVRGVDLWGAKLSQAALMNNHHVVHFLLSHCDIDSINPDLSEITSRIDLGTGDVNMFEVFGDVEDELSLFAIQLEKIKLIAQELYPEKENRGTLEGSLNEVLTDFYIDNNMWRENADANRESLRITNIPHREVPRLREFAAYLAQRYKASVSAKNSDPAIVAANRALNFLFSNMLTANGDIFDAYTTDIIDNAKDGWRIIYDFGSLAARGNSLIMAQFINIFSFAIGELNEGDVIFIHGAELISDIVTNFINMQMRTLRNKGVRIVWIYDSVDSMVDSININTFDEADYTVLGNMSQNVAKKYKDALGQAIPNELIGQIATNEDVSYYIRRGFDNVVFYSDIQLGVEY